MTTPPYAKGTFEVKMSPQVPDPGAEDSAIGRMTIDKTFYGDLAGTSKGQMLAHRTATTGSAGYVAMERVTATLAGRSGSFVLLHCGMMNRGASEMKVVVVPDSGTDELVGLTGSMSIRVADGKHYYELEYTL